MWVMTPLALAAAGGSGGDPAFVQKGALSYGDGSTSNTPTISGVTIGNLLVCTVWSVNNNNGVSAISAPSGWSAAENPAGTPWNGNAAVIAEQGAIFYKIATATSESCSITLNGGGSFSGASIAEFSGVTTLDVHTNFVSSGATSCTVGPTGTPSADKSITIALLATDNYQDVQDISSPPATGYTTIYVEPNDFSHGAGCSGYKINSAAAAQSASWTWTHSGATVACIAVFK